MLILALAHTLKGQANLCHIISVTIVHTVECEVHKSLKKTMTALCNAITAGLVCTCEQKETSSKKSVSPHIRTTFLLTCPKMFLKTTKRR